MAKDVDIRNIENMISDLHDLLECIKLGDIEVVSSYTAQVNQGRHGVKSVTHYVLYEELDAEGWDGD